MEMPYASELDTAQNDLILLRMRLRPKLASSVGPAQTSSSDT